MFFSFFFLCIYTVQLWSSPAGAARSLLSGSRAAPMATAGGMLSMLGVQAARAVTSMMQRMHIVDLVVLTDMRHACVPAPARVTAPMAIAGGMLSMLGHRRLMPTRLGARPQEAHANKIDEAAKSHLGRGGLPG